MNQQAADNYLRIKVMTATPEQLQLMLYDGAIRFAEQGKAGLVSRNYEQSYNGLSRAMKIIAELTCSLKHDVAPELCGKLSALYTYVYRKLTESNVDRNIAPLDEALELLRFQRETWAMLLERLGKTKAAAAASKLDLPSPDARMESQLRMTG